MEAVYLVLQGYERPIAAFMTERLAQEFRQAAPPGQKSDLKVKEYQLFDSMPERVTLFRAQVPTSQPGGTSDGSVDRTEQWAGLDVPGPSIKPVSERRDRKGYVEVVGYEEAAVKEAAVRMARAKGVQRVAWERA